jgi:hypothetical protein
MTAKRDRPVLEERAWNRRSVRESAPMPFAILAGGSGCSAR